MSPVDLSTVIRSHRRWRWLAAGVLFLIVVAFGPTLVSRLVGNIGLVILNRSLAQHGVVLSDVRSDPNLAQAEQWLRLATGVDARNQGAWRGMGFTLATQGRESEALAAWTTIGVAALEFVERGNVARVARRYDEALAWYTRATQLQPDVGDAWYYTGLIHQAKSQWDKARDAFEQSLAASALDTVGRSSAYYRLGAILFQWTNPLDIDGALAAFSTAVALNQFDTHIEKSDAHYKIGAIYELQGLDPRQQVVEFQTAVDLNPSHAWAHLRLGYVQYILTRDVALAEREIEQAIELWPSDSNRKWPYRYLGDIYRQAGQLDKAIDAYRQALQYDANDRHVTEWLGSLLSQPDHPTSPSDSK